MVDHLAEAASHFLKEVVTPPLSEVGGLLADRVKWFRFKNQVTVLSKAEKYLRDNNIKAKKVSLKVLTPMLEYSGMEEDETLQEKWAALFANTASNPDEMDTTLYAHILSELSKKDAMIFQFIADLSVQTHSGTFINEQNGRPASLTVSYKKNEYLAADTVNKVFGYSEINLDNLYRLRLIKPAGARSGDQDIFFIMTDLGFRFLSAVSTAMTTKETTM